MTNPPPSPPPTPPPPDDDLDDSGFRAAIAGIMADVRRLVPGTQPPAEQPPPTGGSTCW